MKHTPGPWALHIDELAVFGAEPNRQQVVDCEVSSPNLTDVERKANARLIAAAPELLAALKTLFDDYKQLADSGDCGFWKLEDQSAGKRALTAIAKAEGQP
jgi:hypothetical protein